jgi:hypothetical protein
VRPALILASLLAAAMPTAACGPADDAPDGNAASAGGEVMSSPSVPPSPVPTPTSVAASTIELGDDLFVNGTRRPTTFAARYVYANIGRIDGVILSFDGREMVLGRQLRGSAPQPTRVALSTYVEIIRFDQGADRPAGLTDLVAGRRVGMVVYRPHDGLARATRIWIEH